MNSSSNRKVKTMKMKKIILAGLMSFAGFLFADDAVDDSYWSDGEWVDMASEATGVDSQKVIEGILKGLEKVELTKGYKSPIGQAERAKIIKSVSARHGKIWIPRKLSTVIGRLEEMLGYASKGLEAVDAAGKAFDIGKIIGIALGAKSLEDAAEIYASEGMYQGSAFGEAGYWISTIAVGLYNGRSLTEAIEDGYDEKNVGKWTKAGFKIGEWFANTVNSMPWKQEEHTAADNAFRAALIRQGINEEGLAIIDQWLSNDLETRVRNPIKVDPAWFKKKEQPPSGGNGGSGQVCKPGEDPFEDPPENDGNGKMCPVPGGGSNSGGGHSGGVRIPKPAPGTRVRRGGGGDTKARIW